VSDERVYVVPRAALPDEAGWYGLQTEGMDDFVAAVERDGRFEPRAAMEQDPSSSRSSRTWSCVMERATS
jgi:hypothetical protein